MSPDPAYKLDAVAPVFAVTDVSASLAYYTEKLLFSVVFTWSDQEGEPPNYAIVRQGNCELHLTLAKQPHVAVAYIFVDRVESFGDAAKAAGATITHDIEDQPWEMREFEVADPDGNRLIFGEHLSRIGGEKA